MTNNEIVKILNSLIVLDADADTGLHAAAEEVRDTNLKTQLHQFAQSHATMRGELQAEVLRLGADPKEEPSFSGKVRRIWIEVKTAFTDKDETAVLKVCATAEQSVLEEHEDTLKKGLPMNSREVVERHFGEIKQMAATLQQQHERFKALQNA